MPDTKPIQGFREFLDKVDRQLGQRTSAVFEEKNGNRTEIIKNGFGSREDTLSRDVFLGNVISQVMQREGDGETVTIQHPSAGKSYIEFYGFDERTALTNAGEKASILNGAKNILAQDNPDVSVELANYNEIAQALYDDPQARLTIKGHTDTMGSDGYNDALSQDRVSDTIDNLFAAYKLLDSDASMTDFRARLNTEYVEISADGEKNNLENTGDNVKSALNRRVEIAWETAPRAPELIKDLEHGKHGDHDNHQHNVFLKIGGANTTPINYSPMAREDDGYFGEIVADEEVKFIIDNPSQYMAKINYGSADHHGNMFTNDVANNTRFMFLHDNPNQELTSHFDLKTNTISVSAGKNVIGKIKIPNDIDPAVIRVESVNSDGVSTQVALDNLDDVLESISPLRQDGSINPLTDAAQGIYQLSNEAVEIHARNGDRNLNATLKDMQEAGLLAKQGGKLVAGARLDEALAELDELSDLDVSKLKEAFVRQYTDPNSVMYHPDERMFPYQTYTALQDVDSTATDPRAVYNELIARVNDKPSIGDELKNEMNKDNDPVAAVTVDGPNLTH